MPKIGQFDPRKVSCGFDFESEMTPTRMATLASLEEARFLRAQALVAKTVAIEEAHLPPSIPEVIADVAITGYNEL